MCQIILVLKELLEAGVQMTVIVSKRHFTHNANFELALTCHFVSVVGATFMIHLQIPVINLCLALSVQIIMTVLKKI